VSKERKRNYLPRIIADFVFLFLKANVTCRLKNSNNGKDDLKNSWVFLSPFFVSFYTSFSVVEICSNSLRMGTPFALKDV